MTRYQAIRNLCLLSLAVGILIGFLAGYVAYADAKARKFTPPSRHRAQVLAGRAYEKPLRATWGKHAEIITRCRGSKQPGRYYCVTYVNLDGQRIFSENTRLVWKRGESKTFISDDLRGHVRVNDVTYLLSTLFSDDDR